MLALFCKVREQTGIGEADAPCFDINRDDLKLYMDGGSELCEGMERTEILDAMRMCRGLINPRSG